MPFKIVRNDITKVKADIIVNTANPRPLYASGTDTAVYQAAGAEKLLAERQRIGGIARGDIAVTPAFALNAKYIIHTVGPKWIDGNHHEFEILENCYRKSLLKAVELGCESIAFPLIASGANGFPKDKALQIAIREFSQFLLTNEIQIILVVFDKKSFQLSSQLIANVDSYIDANYVKAKRLQEYSSRLSRFIIDEEKAESIYKSRRMEEHICCCCAPPPPVPPVKPAKAKPFSIDLNKVGPSFHDKLFELIDAAGIDNKDVWKKANLDRKHFSKIQCNKEYHPNKKTVMALCIALQLNLEQSKDLLSRADWAFSPSSKLDLIVQKAIEDKVYDIYQLNLVLFQYTNEVLGV